MFESFGFETLTAPQAALIAALTFGALFGVLAEVSRFCLRRAVLGEVKAGAVWLTALATAVIGTQALTAAGLVDLSTHRFHASELPWLAITIGGLAFGVGMVLTRGCVSRLTVLTASGNLRALTVLFVIALTAHATMKGLLAPLREALQSPTLTLAAPTLPGGSVLWAALITAAAITLAFRARPRPLTLLAGVLIGLLIPAAWVTTGYVLYDDFDPVALDALSFTAPLGEALFYTIASSAISPSFGAALIAGVLGGAGLSALVAGRFAFQSFETPSQTGRYLSGGALMGAGGVLAGGCTVGAGLSGVSTLSVAAVLALAAIVTGGWVANRLLSGTASGSSAPSAIPQTLPAE